MILFYNLHECAASILKLIPFERQGFSQLSASVRRAAAVYKMLVFVHDDVIHARSATQAARNGAAISAKKRGVICVMMLADNGSEVGEWQQRESINNTTTRTILRARLPRRRICIM